MTTDVLLDLQETARRLCVSVKTVRKRIANRELDGVQLSKRIWRVSERALQCYIDRNTFGEKRSTQRVRQGRMEAHASND